LDKLATDTRRLTQTFVQRTSLDKKSHRFANKLDVYRGQLDEENYHVNPVDPV
jgi:sensor histidine kinase regulating citrate/malate metabolism